MLRAADLPVATTWFLRADIGDGITRITEPHVDILEQANVWHVRGRDRDLLIDSGMGVVPLRPAFPDLFEGRETIALATHTHLDHIGGIHEFEHRWVHPIEADLLEHPQGGTLISAEMPLDLRERFVAAGYPPLGDYLIHALPYPGYEPETYVLHGGTPTRLIREGEYIDLGDRRFTVLLVPGHSPGSIALFEEATGILFAGDVIYDGPLLYEGPGMDVHAYRRSFDLLESLPISIVHAGHDPSFGKSRLDAIIAAYRERWRREGFDD
jgi:glyoxylase-like metal-dependent hydrolase (beta-lactamase superfamily II)